MAEDGEGGERTEPATAKRIRSAREQGQVALSREAVGLAGLLASAAAAALLAPGQMERLLAAMRGTLSRSHALGPEAALEWAWLFLGMMWPVAVAGGLGVMLATIAQTRGTISAAALTPSLSKLSPLAGAGRLLGGEALLEFGRTCLKLCVVAGALWMVAADLPGLGAVLDAPPSGLLAAAGAGILRLLGAPLAAFALLALGDLILVRLRHLARLRMTRQEVKEELKESDGDPMVKGRLRQLRQSKGRQRMLAAVPQAAVVITNPTHYAVALAYEPGQSAAPRVVAKGVDSMAARIRDAARAAGVPIVPDPPLARALHRLEVDAEIPAEHWDAVARTIAFVLRLRGRG